MLLGQRGVIRGNDLRYASQGAQESDRAFAKSRRPQLVSVLRVEEGGEGLAVGFNARGRTRGRREWRDLRQAEKFPELFAVAWKEGQICAVLWYTGISIGLENWSNAALGCLDLGFLRLRCRYVLSNSSNCFPPPC